MLPQRVTKKIGLRLGGGWFVVVGSTPIGSVYRLGDAWFTIPGALIQPWGLVFTLPRGHSTGTAPVLSRHVNACGPDPRPVSARTGKPGPATTPTHPTPTRLPPLVTPLPVLHRIPATPHKEGVWVEIQKRVWVGIWVCPQNHQVLGARSPLTHQTPHKRGIGWVCPAASYSPTHSRVQYHRRYEA